MQPEQIRLQAARDPKTPWKKWGPYLSERQWGTVREDYSENGDAWNYFTHDQARSRAYRWGEDGLGGISDDHQVLCFALALWNGNDPILKERAFGLNNSEGNHGEDVKEYYFYLDSTPTHSYMKYLYKYPQAAYPYEDLIVTNRNRSKDELEYELLNTGIFNEDRYFDVFVEYAKADTEDILIKISICNRGPEAAPLHVLPTLWFRNTWSWADASSKPILQKVENPTGSTIHDHHTEPLFQEFLDDYYLYCDGNVPLLFTENETNNARLFAGTNASPYVKDGINNYLVYGQPDAVNPLQTGTKVSPHYQLTVDAGATQVVRLRLTRTVPAQMSQPFAGFDTTFQTRIQEADAFYDAITPAKVKAELPEKANLMRQALAGMLWSKQYFYYDVDKWLEEHHITPWSGAEQRHRIRNGDWYHAYCDDIISMPDKWEYPWFAAWDLAFHMLPLSIVDSDFAKAQLDLMLRNDYLHPNGQIRALSRYHQEHPFIFHYGGQEFRVDYLPGDSNSGMFGGNSNWRGPIWMPVNFILLRALYQLYAYYGDSFTVECPTGSGQFMTLFEVAQELGDRLTRIFLPDENGRRPVYGGAEKFQTDPYWKDYILFYEYFHGDNGAGIGASHQTGWTGCIARIIQIMGDVTPETLRAADFEMAALKKTVGK